MVWCFSKISLIIWEHPKAVKTSPDLETSNFVEAMDTALDLIGPLTMFSDDAPEKSPSSTSGGCKNATKIRKVVNSLIGHALSFANLAQPNDRTPLTTICQSVLKECIEFEGFSSFDSDRSIFHLDNQSQFQLSATRLESVLYQLDGLVNDSLLRLVYGVFVEMSMKPLDQLAELVECGQMSQEVDDQIVRFDEMADRLQQIGVFAAAFAADVQGKHIQIGFVI